MQGGESARAGREDGWPGWNFGGGRNRASSLRKAGGGGAVAEWRMRRSLR